MEEKNKVLESAVKLFRMKEDIIRLKVMYLKQKRKNQNKKIKKSINDGIIFIKGKLNDINNDLFTKYFDFSAPIDLTNKLYKTKDAKKNSELVEEIRNRWSNLKDRIKKNV